MFEYFLMAAAVCIIIALLLYFKSLYKDQKNRPLYKKRGKNHKSSTNGISIAACPICGTSLLPGNNLSSKVFRSPGKVNDQICYIYGCKTCYPKKDSFIQRNCPVCHKEVPQESYLLCRMFNKTKSGKPHVIINGCGNCNRH